MRHAFVLAVSAVAAPAQPGSDPAAAAGLRAITTPDGSRCILLPLPGPPIVHWVVFTPAGPGDEADGLEGLAVAVARAAMSGTARLGSRNRATEEELLLRVEANERRRALLQRAGQPVPQDLLASLREDAIQADAVADRLAWERALRQAPAGPSRLSRTADGTLLQLCMPVEAVGRVAALLVARREEPILRGLYDQLRAVRADLVARAADDPWTVLRDEVRSLAYGALPLGRPSLITTEAPTPLSRAQALATFARTQRPDRTWHVLAGGFAVEPMVELLQKALATSTLTSDPLAPARPAPQPRGARTSQRSGGAFAGIAIGMRVPPAADPDALALVTAWLAAGDESFLSRWLHAEGVRPSMLRGTYPFPGPGPDAMVLLEVAASAEDAGDSERLRRVFAAVDAGLEAAAKQAPLQKELHLARAFLTAERGTLCATPERMATFIALRCAAFGLPPEQALRPLDAVGDGAVHDLLPELLAPERRVRAVQEKAP